MLPPSTDESPSTVEHRASQEVFSREDIVEFYETFVDGLLSGEEYVFSRAIRPGARILDLGVGAGRTTPFLSERASTYVGLDYSPGMIASCRRHFPHLEFVEGDASKLTMFEDASFDVVVFSFNGIDCLHPDASRLACLREIHRVLVTGGVVVFSEHNPRALIVRPRGLRGGSPKLGAVRLWRAARETAVRVARLGHNPMVWRGAGYYFDAEHGGNLWHAAVPRRVVSEVEPLGFRRVGEIVGFDHPAPAGRFVTGWYYYTFVKR